MFFPIFTLFIIFIAWFTYECKKHSKISESSSNEFWAKESLSNNTRKKSLDNLNYTIVNPENLPVDNHGDSEINDYIMIINDLSSKRLFNTGNATNTELKSEYGVANLPTLQEYDSNFVLFEDTIYKWGVKLNNLHFEDESIEVLQYGIDSLTDISGNYKLLGDLYLKKNQLDKIEALIDRADNLDSLLKTSTIQYLKNLLIR